jgi:hypothetical protein
MPPPPLAASSGGLSVASSLEQAGQSASRPIAALADKARPSTTARMNRRAPTAMRV